MWTNVFRIGGLQHLSWFQLLPLEDDLIPLSDKRSRSDHCDSDRLLVLSSHLQLQKEGFLSAWTNSFVGPWDPSQGLHNPDDKIKLWLFIPGHHSFIIETAQAAVSKLRVVASGTWISPGDSEEVSFALAQSLRNCIERSFVGLSYVRFGEVFSRYHSFSPSEESHRRGQATIEFIFAAADDAIYVHAIVSAKHIRALCSDDIVMAVHGSSKDSNDSVQVVVSPHGMRGKLTGFCPSNLVQEIYSNSGQFKTSNRLVGLPFQASQQHGCHLRGQNCYVEVTLGHYEHHNLNNDKNFKRRLDPSIMRKGDINRSLEHSLQFERTFIYPVEAVIIPVLQTSLARSSLKRVWLQNWKGPSISGPSFFIPSSWKMNSFGGSCTSPHTLGVDSSNIDSSDSSISSLSYSSSGTDHKMDIDVGDLKADADSLPGMQYGLSTKGRTMGSRTLTGHKRLNGQIIEGMHIPDKSQLNYGAEGNSVGGCLGWDHDEDETGMYMDMDIKTLLSELGDFGNFFETDDLPFGEPPGSAKPQNLAISAPDCSDIACSPGVGVIEFPDQMTLPSVFPSTDSLIPLHNVMDESLSRDIECSDIVPFPGLVDITPVTSSVEFDHLVKAEALWTFAPEYGAVQIEISKTSLSLFREPYIPESRKVESPSSSSNSYVYNASPPLSTFPSTCQSQKHGTYNKHLGKRDSGATHNSKNCYTVVGSLKEQHTNRLPTNHSNSAANEGIVMPAYSNGVPKTDASPNQKGDRTLAMKISPSLKNVLATELECLMYQSSMCRARHTTLTSSALSSGNFSKFTQTAGPSNQFAGDISSMVDNIYSKYDVQQTDTTPHRFDNTFEGIADGPINTPVGVWRTIGVSKGGKLSNSPIVDMSPALTHKSFSDEGMHGPIQPLQELLDGMSLLVQQATSLVDATLDADQGDGPSGWLAMQEQLMHGFSCGPSMVHGGCGGSLASCHSLDAAGVELIDPLSVDVHASSVISLLQSDIKVALKSAFGILEGPLTITDWCKGSSQFVEAGTPGDGFSAESTITDCIGSSSTISFLVDEPISPSLSSVSGSSSLKVSGITDVHRVEEIRQRRSITESSSLELDQQLSSRAKASLLVLPLPSILVGYQDDWLKTSVNSIQFWEKAPLEPYATQKHMAYHVICPDINPLTSAAVDFFQQLGTVYETCKLGSHSPLPFSNQMEIDSGKLGSAGFVLLESPQSMQVESSNSTLAGVVSDYFLSLSKGWDLTSFLGSLSKVLKGLKIDFSSNSNSKDTSNCSSVVLYVVCPFPDPVAILQTIVESSVAIGSVIFSTNIERRSMLYSQVSKALNGSPTADEASSSNVLTISGFNVPKLVMQIISVETILRVTNPAYSELAILKETAFTVYNKARRVSRGSFSDGLYSSCLPSRSQSKSTLMSINSPISGMWKDAVGSRMTGSSIPRDGEWDNSWHAVRSSGLSYDSNRMGEYLMQDDLRYMFEPLFILAEPGCIDHGISPGTSNISTDSLILLHGDSTSASSGNVDNSPNSQHDMSGNSDGHGSEHQKSVPCLHCCYGWTEDWRWLVCIWTDSRGELLDSQIFPFGGISSRQNTKGLQSLFVQVLHQGCLMLQACTSLDTAAAKPRDFIISRIGCFYELECQEWQKAICSFGGSDIKKWPHQLRRPLTNDLPVSSNGPQAQDIGLIHDRTLPSSPSSMYAPQTKASGYIKTGLGQASSRKQMMGGHIAVESTKGSLHWIKSISFIALAVDHTLQLVSQADLVSRGGTQSNHFLSPPSYLDGFTPVKPLGSASASYIFIPSSTMHFLPTQPLQLPTCLTAESPPLAHLLHSKGSAVPLTTGFVVSKAVPSVRKDLRSNAKDEWPSILSVSLIDYYGGKHATQEKACRAGAVKPGDRATSNGDTKDLAVDTRVILESIAAELHALSWMTSSPTYLDRRTALPLHCDMVLRLRRLLHFAETQLSSHPNRSQTQQKQANVSVV